MQAKGKASQVQAAAQAGAGCRHPRGERSRKASVTSVDEFAPFMLFLVLGNFLNHFFLGLGVGWVVSHLYRRFKNTRPDGYLLHLLYWVGLLPLVGRTMVNPYQREYAP
jgi:conjugal transfer pilus assembly protein TraL